MTDKEPKSSGSGEELIDNQEWLENALSVENDELDRPYAKWATLGAEHIAEVVSRAEAHINTGGTLSAKSLEELSRMLGLLHSTAGMDLGLSETEKTDRLNAQARYGELAVKVRDLRQAKANDED